MLLRGAFMGRRTIGNNIFTEIVLGLSGQDTLGILNALADIQSSVFEGSAKKDLKAIKKLEEKINSYPLRYRLISKGFVCKWNLDTLNKNLLEKTGAKLYARDLIEATLIYSFKNALTFDAWRELVAVLKELEESGSYNELIITGSNGSYSSFPLSKIEAYVKGSALLANETQYTIQKTRTIEQRLDIFSKNKDFALYICENIRSFCIGREKSRYYICKYFLLYLNTRISDYIACTNSRTLKRNIYLDLPLSNISKMDPNRHANMSRDEILSCLGNAKVSSNKLFELLNRFYSYILLSDSDANDPNWEEYSLMSKILKGETISRSLLMLMLLFFGTEADIPDTSLRLSADRMNDILKACSFEELNENAKPYSIDLFILNVLRADDKKRAVNSMLERLTETELIYKP